MKFFFSISSLAMFLAVAIIKAYEKQWFEMVAFLWIIFLKLQVIYLMRKVENQSSITK